MQKTIRHLLSFGFICILCLIPLSSVMALSNPEFTNEMGHCSSTNQPVSAQPFGGTIGAIPNTGYGVLYFYDNYTVLSGNTIHYYIANTAAACDDNETEITETIDVSSVCGSGITVTRRTGCKSTSGSGGVTIPGGGFTNNCTNCVSDTDFTVVPLNPGYKRKVKRVCVASKCRILSTEYECAGGYYQSGDITCETVNYMLRCSGCTKECTNDKTETDYPVTGYVKETKYTCNDKGMYELGETTHKCAKGYYGENPTCNGTVCSGCTRCPYDESIGVYGTTDDVGTTDKSYCHLPVGTYTDTKGTFEVTSTSNYTISGQQYCSQQTN